MWTKVQIREKLKTDDRWLLRGLIAIYRHQTEEEQATEATLEHNGVGFNGVDAEILSSFARQVQECDFLTPKQLDLARKKMVKYAGQLERIQKQPA